MNIYIYKMIGEEKLILCPRFSPPDERFTRNNTTPLKLFFLFFFLFFPSLLSLSNFFFSSLKLSSLLATWHRGSSTKTPHSVESWRGGGGGSHDSRRFSRRKTLNRAPIHEEIEIPRRASLFRRGTLSHVPPYSLYFRSSPIYEIVGTFFFSFFFFLLNFYNFTIFPPRFE